MGPLLSTEIKDEYDMDKYLYRSKTAAYNKSSIPNLHGGLAECPLKLGQ